MNKVLISKSAEEKRQALFIVMEPDVVDDHGDVTSAEEVRKACYNFNKFCRQPNLYHIANTESFEFAESYVAPADFTIEETVIKAGTWLATIQVNNEDLWAAIKDGEVSGLSIGALATVEDIE